ncbi:MAG: hypothetical protein AB7O62_25080, partial [Pirellulales bacterium]
MKTRLAILVGLIFAGVGGFLAWRAWSVDPNEPNYGGKRQSDGIGEMDSKSGERQQAAHSANIHRGPNAKNPG